LLASKGFQGLDIDCVKTFFLVAPATVTTKISVVNIVAPMTIDTAPIVLVVFV
jgi:hypothetical protein